MRLSAPWIFKAVKTNGTKITLHILNFPRSPIALTQRYGHLGNGGGVHRPLDALHAPVEDPGYPVCLREYGAVADAQAEPEAYPHHGASFHRRLRQDHEGHWVAAEDAAEQDVAELASRRHDHRRPVVVDEHAGREEGAEDADAAEGQRDDGPGVGPAHHQRGELHALRLVRVGRETWGKKTGVGRCRTRTRLLTCQARPAAVVEDVRVLSARHADPAALVLEVPDVARRTCIAAYRLRQGVGFLPAQQAQVQF